jgi:hypothetical protein
MKEELTGGRKIREREGEPTVGKSLLVSSGVSTRDPGQDRR